MKTKRKNISYCTYYFICTKQFRVFFPLFKWIINRKSARPRVKREKKKRRYIRKKKTVRSRYHKTLGRDRVSAKTVLETTARESSTRFARNARVAWTGTVHFAMILCLFFSTGLRFLSFVFISVSLSPYSRFFFRRDNENRTKIYKRHVVIVNIFYYIRPLNVGNDSSTQNFVVFFFFVLTLTGDAYRIYQGNPTET